MTERRSTFAVFRQESIDAKRDGDIEARPDIDSKETRRSNPDDGQRFAIKTDGSTQDTGFATVFALPKRMTHDDAG